MKKTTFRISSHLFERLQRHLFPGDGDEHGAILLAGMAETENQIRFLARDLVLARDGHEFVPGSFGYRAFPADFVARVSNRCARERLCYFSVHCHGGTDSVEFSSVDLESHERGYPALLDITRGGPVGGLVFAKNAVAGEIWTKAGTYDLDEMVVIGMNTRRLYPKLPRLEGASEEIYHRQSLMFGDIGQFYLRQARVGIIGLGGVGSLINEYLARVGVGEIIAVDFDKVEPSNRSRIVGSVPSDSCDWLRKSRFQFLRRLGERKAKHKVSVAERVARQANTNVNFQAVIGDITEQSTANRLRDVDFIFLCADSMQSRLVFNALVHHYLIPGVQIGSKVAVDQISGKLGDITCVSRLVLPESGAGCLLCNELIPAAKLQEEALTEEERRQQAYVGDNLVTAPSVITLNGIGASHAANMFLFSLLGLFNEASPKNMYSMYYARENKWRHVDCRADSTCLHCGISEMSGYGRGDRASLPCKTR